MPRRFTNQCEMSAISGAKVVEQPNPIRNPCASANCHRLGGKARGDEAQPQQRRTEECREQDAETIGQPPHRHAAERETHRQHGVRQRRVGARDAEIGLDRGQRDHKGPHADAAERAQQTAKFRAETRNRTNPSDRIRRDGRASSCRAAFGSIHQRMRSQTFTPLIPAPKTRKPAAGAGKAQQ